MKEEIKQHLLNQIEADILQAQQSYSSAKELTCGEESKAESKWDTRSIEAGYLASAQKQRLEELKLEKQLIEELNTAPTDPQGSITIGTLITLKHNNLVRKYFLSSTAGGKVVDIQQNKIMIISVFSPLGKELLGLSTGDQIELELPSGSKLYDILAIE